MKKREAEFGKLFRHWLKANPLKFSAVFELKQTQSNSIAFDSVAPHQIDALQSVNSSQGILYKAPDDSRGIKPFDYFYMKNSPAFIVIRYPKSFEIISIEQFVAERDRSKRKSLTAERAKAISTISVTL